MKISPREGMNVSIVYSGEMSCHDSSYPFIMGASMDDVSTTLNFYSISGEPLFRVNQVKDGMTFRFQVIEAGIGVSEMERGVLTIMERIGSAYSLGGIVTGKLPFHSREGDLFVTRRGFLYRGDGFSVVADEKMRLIEADYRVKNISFDLAYSYTGEDDELPYLLDFFALRCSFSLEVERTYRGKGYDG